MIQFGRKRQPVYQVLVPWVAIVLAMVVLSYVFQWLHASDISESIIEEVVVFALVYFLNRYWLKIEIYMKSDLSLRRQIKVNTFPLIWIILLLLALVFDFPKGKSLGEIVSIIVVALLVGIFEEYLFRGILLNGFLQRLHWRRETNLFWAIVFSSLIFSGSHLMNLSHQSLTLTIMQVIMTFGFGLMQSATYLRTRSLVWPIMFHFMVDMQAMLRTSLMQTHVYIPIWVGVVLMVMYGTVALILLRPSKRADVLTYFRV